MTICRQETLNKITFLYNNIHFLCKRKEKCTFQRNYICQKPSCDGFMKIVKGFINQFGVILSIPVILFPHILFSMDGNGVRFKNLHEVFYFL